MNVLSSSKIASELLERVGIIMKITEKLFDVKLDFECFCIYKIYNENR